MCSTWLAEAEAEAKVTKESPAKESPAKASPAKASPVKESPAKEPQEAKADDKPKGKRGRTAKGKGSEAVEAEEKVMHACHRRLVKGQVCRFRGFLVHFIILHVQVVLQHCSALFAEGSQSLCALSPPSTPTRALAQARRVPAAILLRPADRRCCCWQPNSQTYVGIDCYCESLYAACHCIPALACNV